MSIFVEEIWEALNYAATSPFVKKMQGDRYSDKEMEVAQSIYESSAMLGSVRKEHENVLSVLSEASKDPERYEKAIAEKVHKQVMDIEKRVAKSRQEYEAVPKNDEAYIASCQEELRRIGDYKRQKEKEIRDSFEKKFEKEKKVRKNRLILSALAIPFVIISILPIFNIDLCGVREMPAMIPAFCVLFGGSMLISAPFVFFMKPKRTSESIIQKEIDKAMPTFERVEAQVNEKIELGHDVNSEFHYTLIEETRKWAAVLGEAKAASKVFEDISVMVKNGFQSGITLMQKVVDNFDSLNSWAANYLRDQAQREHNEKMIAIEKAKLREQESASRAQVSAMKEQNEFLDRQARAAEQQARDSAEIRRRMENERYGEYWKSSNN